MEAPRKRKAGHRSWAPGNAKVSGTHVGDIMSAEKRSALMSRIRGTNTGPERTMALLLSERGLRFETHARDLPGRPDFVFREIRLAVFLDGDFWHGWRFPLWQHKLAAKWQTKIATTRARDQRNFRKLRRSGWKVLRIWEHEVEHDAARCLSRILAQVVPLAERGPLC